ATTPLASLSVLPGLQPCGGAGAADGMGDAPAPPQGSVPWADHEFAGATLGDPRQVRSLRAIAAALAETPHRSLTAACGPAVRQAAHRLFEDKRTSIDGLLAGHYPRTAERCRDQPLVLVAQDTCY